MNAGKCPFAGHEPGLAGLIARVVDKGTFRVTDDFAACSDADAVLIDVQTPVEADHTPRYASLREVSRQVGCEVDEGQSERVKRDA